MRSGCKWLLLCEIWLMEVDIWIMTRVYIYGHLREGIKKKFYSRCLSKAIWRCLGCVGRWSREIPFELEILLKRGQ